MSNLPDHETAAVPLQALIFDVDGTLADTERDVHRVAFNRAFREHGLDWHWDVDIYGRLLRITGGKERILHYMRTAAPDLATSGQCDALVRALHARKTEIYVDLLANGEVVLRPGVVRLLRDAREAGLRLAIATTTTPANVTALLEATVGPAALHWFEVIGAGDVVERKKPAPDIYTFVLDQLGLPAAACFAFEDSANGLRASTVAGLRTIVTPTGYTENEDFTSAYALISDLGEPGARCQQLGAQVPARGLIDIAQLRAWHEALPGGAAPDP